MTAAVQFLGRLRASYAGAQGVALWLLLSLPCHPAKLDITRLAAGTTIAVNVLEIKTHIQNVKKAAKKVKAVTVKTAKKVAGK